MIKEKINTQKMLGMGNALTDILIQLPNTTLLQQFNLAAGSMQLITSEVAQTLAKASANLPKSLATGGSASNTMRAAARLGTECGFIGKIGKDDYGKSFKENLEKCGIQPALAISSDNLSGFAITFITPNGERTFATYLGAAAQLTPEDILPKMFDGYKLFHVEGYLVQNYALIEKAMRIAKEKGLQVSLDLASFNVVEENLDFLKHLVNNYVDIVFANEEEAKAFTGKEAEAAVAEIAAQTHTAIVKIGAKGSLIQQNENLFAIPSVPADRKDTTAAGDFYAAGFLHAYCQGKPLDICGKAGSLMGSSIIEVIGADFTEEKWKIIQNRIKNIIK